MRNRQLDFIKWIAITTMVIDHLRYITIIHNLGFNDILAIIGRIAFPMFCFIMAINFKRIIDQNNIQAIKTYLINLTVFSILSEFPYRLLDSNQFVLNVIPTLLLSMVLLIIVFNKFQYKWLALTAFFSIVIPMSPIFMYGIIGIILPLFCMLLLNERKIIFIVLSMILSALCNLQYYYHTLATIGFTLNIVLISVFSMLAIPLALFVLKQKFTFKVYQVGSWGYSFYPIHLFIFYLINKFN